MSRLSRMLNSSWSQPPFWADEMLHGVTSMVGDRERIGNDFEAYVEQGYKSNGVIFACILARLMPFAEARFMFQELHNGRPGDLVTGPGLDLLERPWPNGTTGELLAHMEQDASLAGNFYATTVGTGRDRRIRRLRPDWMTIVTGVRGDEGQHRPWHIDAEVLGYIYAPPASDDWTLLEPHQVAHWSPIPDPVAQWRGMSWLTPVLNEIKADKATTKHKLKFFENGATSNVVITYDPTISPDGVKKFAAMFAEAHQGVDKAYKTIHLGGGADAKTVGADMKQLDFKATQGAGETRIAAAAGVGAIIARFSEGMQGSSLNQGNYSAAKRQFADMTLRPNWRSAAGALSRLVGTPPAHRLWYDARDVTFLAEDQTDAATVLSANATTVTTLVREGFTPESAVAAVQAGDLSILEHTGRMSVQLTSPEE